MTRLILLMLSLGACTSAAKEPIDMIAGASFGSKENRVQFHKDGGELMKLSYNVGSYDNISGATYSLESTKDNTFLYKSGVNTVTVNIIDTNTVEIIDSESTKTFTPRGRNLGKRPK